MKKIMILIIVISMLLTTVPSGIVGEKAVNEEQSIYGELFSVNEQPIFEYKSVNGELIQYNSNNDSEKLPKFAPGEIIVKFKENVQIEIQESTSEILDSSVSSRKSMDVSKDVVKPSDRTLITDIDSIDQLNTEYGVISIEKLFSDTDIPSLANIYKFTFPFDTDIKELMSGYNNDDNVVYAEPNYIFTTSYAQKPAQKLIPNDPLFSQQWALNQSNDCDIDAPESWGIKTGDPNVVIAIVDTGVDYNHPDLAANIWHDPIYGNPGYDFVDINTTLYIEAGFNLCEDEDYTIPDSDPMDVSGHGTHCAGISGAVTNNSVGVAGVSWNCKIMPVRNAFKIEYNGDIYGAMEEGDSAYAIVYAADNGADVISMSWGGYVYSSLIVDVIDYAYCKDVVLVAAAGNDNEDVRHFPAYLKNVIAVAATDKVDSKDYFSNFGSWVDVAAPGADILSTFPNGQYVIASGTSMACPHVAGLAGLLISKHQQCPYPAQMVKSMLPFSTDKINSNNYVGAGRINSYKALNHKAFAAELEDFTDWEDVKGLVDIKGSTWGEEFKYFTLEIGQGEKPNSWTELLNSTTPLGNILYSLDTCILQEGLYTLKLKVSCNHGVYFDNTLIYVNNEADGSYNADKYVSNCYDSNTVGWGITKFNKIQDAIDNATPGNTIFVYDGIYRENINIRGLSKSSISLIGQHKNWTIIDSKKNINISFTGHIKIDGFNIRQQVIIFTSGNCVISNNKIMFHEKYINLCSKDKDFICVYIVTSLNNIVSGNIIGEFENPFYFGGIHLFISSDNTISSNNITYHLSSIIIQTNSNRNLIQNNTCSLYVPTCGCHTTGVGITIAYSRNNLVRNNSLNNGFSGILLQNTFLNTITKNKFKNSIFHDVGLMGSCSFNKIIANEISEYIAILDNCQYNKIYYNNFYDNFGAYDSKGIDSKNCWYKEKLFGDDKGNYWSKYPKWHMEKYGTEAKDENNDSIWDDPIDIHCSDSNEPNQDKYPVVEPFDIENIDVNSVLTEELTIEESQYLTQLEEMINNYILSGELNYNEIIAQSQQNSPTPQTQPSSQPISKTLAQTTIGSTILLSKTTSK